MEETEREESRSDLYLDTSDLLNTNRQQGTSVTDQYGVDVFSDRFEDMAKQIDEKSLQEKQMEEKLFVTEAGTVSDNGVAGQLFGDIRSYFEVDDNAEGGTDTVSYTVILSVFVLMTFTFIYMKIRKKDKHERHHTRSRNGNADEYQD